MAMGVTPVSAGTVSPLGRFSALITAGVTVMSLAFAFLTHVGAFGWQSDPFIDLVASIAVGVVFGRTVGISEGQNSMQSALADRGNLNTSLALAAHDRLDQIGAPSAPLDHSGTTVGATLGKDG